MQGERKVRIIAEAGVNHNGDIELAKQLIDSAANAGADVVKFQTFNASRIATEAAAKAEYQTLTTDKTQSQVAMLSQLELCSEMHTILVAHCRVRNIQFFLLDLTSRALIFWPPLVLNVLKFHLEKLQIYLTCLVSRHLESR